MNPSVNDSHMERGRLVVGYRFRLSGTICRNTLRRGVLNDPVKTLVL